MIAPRLRELFDVCEAQAERIRFLCRRRIDVLGRKAVENEQRSRSANRLGLFEQTTETRHDNKQAERQGKRKRPSDDEHTPDRVAAGVGGCAQAAPRQGEVPDPRA
jgi:hypothetical protein